MSNRKSLAGALCEGFDLVQSRHNIVVCPSGQSQQPGRHGWSSEFSCTDGSVWLTATVDGLAVLLHSNPGSRCTVDSNTGGHCPGLCCQLHSLF